MLLTLKPSAQNRVKRPHDYSIIRQSLLAPESSPPMVPDTPAAAAPSRSAVDRSVDSSLRGLPPPSSMSPSPDISRSNMAHRSELPPASLICSTPDVTCQWLQTKAEEDRRRQEEEKTRQEALRLEQRKIEQGMLRDSLQSGVPPHMIPLIFAGISGGSLPQSAMELIQKYTNPTTSSAPPPPASPALAPAPQQRFHSALDLPPPLSLSQRRPPLAVPTDIRRDSRILPPNPYAAPPVQQQPIPGPAVSRPLPPHGPSPTNQSFGRSPLAGGPADAQVMRLSQINNVETPLQHPPVTLPSAQYKPGSSVPPSQYTGVKQEHPPRQSHPSLYFHHWVPPAQSQPSTPLGKSSDSPLIPHTQSQRRFEHQSSPGRKRKSQNPHQQPPLPSSRPSDTAPASLQTSRPASPAAGDRSTHHRQRSEASSSCDSRAQDRQEADQDPAPTNQTLHASSSGSPKSLPQEDVSSDSTSLPTYPPSVADSNTNSDKADVAADRSPRHQS